MRVIRIQEKDKLEGEFSGGLDFINTSGRFTLYTMELRAQTCFMVDQGSALEKKIDSLSREGKDIEDDLPALRGAAVRLLRETDYAIIRIDKVGKNPETRLRNVLLQETLRSQIQRKDPEEDTVEIL